jgi:hypothetical protein
MDLELRIAVGVVQIQYVSGALLLCRFGAKRPAGVWGGAGQQPAAGQSFSSPEFETLQDEGPTEYPFFWW